MSAPGIRNEHPTRAFLRVVKFQIFDSELFQMTIALFLVLGSFVFVLRLNFGQFRNFRLTFKYAFSTLDFTDLRNFQKRFIQASPKKPQKGFLFTKLPTTVKPRLYTSPTICGLFLRRFELHEWIILKTNYVDFLFCWNGEKRGLIETNLFPAPIV